MSRTLFAFFLAAALATASPARAQHDGHSAHHMPSTSASAAGMLASSTPADGAVLAEAPRTLALTFAHPVMLQTVVVAGPGDAPIRATFRRAAAPTSTWSVALPALQPGAYRVRWTANGGGHAMQGELSFTLQQP